MIRIPIIISKPVREGNSLSRSPEDSKGEYENNDQAATVECRCDQIRIVLEEARLVVSKVVLNIEPRDERGENDTSLCLIEGQKSRIKKDNSKV